MKKVVVVGSINMDVVIRVPHIPAVGETVLAKGLNLFGGGKGANQAIAASRLGGNVSMIGRLGDDAYGKKLIKALTESGVNVKAVEIDSEFPTGTAYIYVSDKGDNNIVVNPGANSKVDKNQIKRHMYLFEDADYCIIQMEIPIDTVEYVISLCKEKNIKVMLNPAPAHNISDEALQNLYMMLPNETELAILCNNSGNLEKMAEHLYSKGVKNVLVTLGEKGCMLVNHEGIKRFPAPPFTPVDTTAAGDSFVAGMTVGLSEGMNFEKAIKFASYVAGITISKEGAQASLPNRKAVDSYFLKCQ
ncbi:MAG: ribokinase [Thermoanaerobacteraceae bacterium]|nr:ribokinase [Thermoanaerobacteraceae bacterium]